jgi:hypothetical protein
MFHRGLMCLSVIWSACSPSDAIVTWQFGQVIWAPKATTSATSAASSATSNFSVMPFLQSRRSPADNVEVLSLEDDVSTQLSYMAARSVPVACRILAVTNRKYACTGQSAHVTAWLVYQYSPMFTGLFTTIYRHVDYCLIGWLQVGISTPAIGGHLEAH